MAQRNVLLMGEDELFADWVAWVRVVKNDLGHLARNRTIFREVSKVFQYNLHLQSVGGYLYQWMRSNYIDSAAMSLRREIDDAQHKGFIHLLGEIAARPRVLTRSRFYDTWGPPSSEEGRWHRQKAFETLPLIRYLDDPMLDHLDESAVLSDLRRLKVETATAKAYIEQTVAHRTHGSPEPITFQQFNAAIDALTPVFGRYHTRLTLQWIPDLEPTVQYNAHEVFTFPWDVTCDGLWNHCRDGQRLPWEEINAAYEAAPPQADTTPTNGEAS
jgi:hypothetical protein